MTLLQLEYIVMLDNYRNFSDAAKHCSVTQPTLSIQIKKIEEELGVLLFYRDKQPVTPTPIGASIVAQARKVLQEVQLIKTLTDKYQNSPEGTVRLGLLPTISPSLLPLLMQEFAEKYPAVDLEIVEDKTAQLLSFLHKDKIDMAIMVYPQNVSNNYAICPLFYERFMVYLSEEHPLLSQETIRPEQLSTANSHAWILEDGHCFKTQCFNFLDLQSAQFLHYQAGQIDTLKKMVNAYKNTVTILPELSLETLSEAEKLRVRPFINPEPVRQISMITQKGFHKTKIMQIVQNEIHRVIPPHFTQLANRAIIAL